MRPRYTCDERNAHLRYESLTSASASCENLDNVSRIFNCGFETDINPNANGTARRMTGSQYLKIMVSSMSNSRKSYHFIMLFKLIGENMCQIP